MFSSRKDDTVSGPSIAIIGAGAGGLACAIALRRQLGYENFKIYEKASDVGGTWRDNVYPGCSSDISMAFYSLSSDLRSWKQSHGSQEDICNYWRELTAKYNLYPMISFESQIKSVDWNIAENKYYLTIENKKTGSMRVETANIVISAVGGLEVPRYPTSIAGLESFKGVVFHSARWRKDVDLKGKKVGVIGNGASATQFVPCITEDPSVQVTEFCRTPNWMMPPIRETYSIFRRNFFHYVPFATRLLRWAIFLRSELFYLNVFANSYLRQFGTKLGRNYIISTAPKEYHDVLIPKFPLGCKRVIFDTNYLNALHRPNLRLNWDGIQSITEDGIITKKGDKYTFDVLIFATGFAADYFALPVKGNTSKSIQEYFEQEKGPKAYLGTVIPGFPNFFTIFGPNTATGHTSVIYSSEVQIQYILQLVRPILDCKVASIEVKRQATDIYNQQLQKRLSRTVFTQCVSWYRAGGDGRITSIFPGSSTLFWWWLRKPKWADFTGVGLDQWRKSSRTRRNRALLLVVLLFSGAAYALPRESLQSGINYFFHYMRSIKFPNLLPFLQT